jgi:UPF0716 protein FxsA
MIWKLVILFTVVPAVELYLILVVGSQIGALPTAVSLLLLGALGAAFARREGFSVLRQIQDDVRRGVAPADGVMEGLLVLAGGILLVAPGYLTDLIGLLCIFPWTRRPLARLVQRRFSARFFSMAAGSVSPVDGFEPRRGPEPREAPPSDLSDGPFSHPTA